MVGRRILKYSFSLNCRNLDLTLGVESNNLAAISSPVIGPGHRQWLLVLRGVLQAEV